MVLGRGRPVERGEEGACAAPTGVCSEPEAHGRGGILSMVLGDGRPGERERERGGRGRVPRRPASSQSRRQTFGCI